MWQGGPPFHYEPAGTHFAWQVNFTVALTFSISSLIYPEIW